MATYRTPAMEKATAEQNARRLLVHIGPILVEHQPHNISCERRLWALRGAARRLARDLSNVALQDQVRKLADELKMMERSR